MKAAIYAGPERLEVIKMETPIKDSENAIVKLSYAGICGTDMMIYSGKHPRAQAPLVMGHEFSGVIDDTPPNSGFEKEDRVVINPLISCKTCPTCQSGNQHICDTLKYLGIDADGGFSEFIKVPLQNLYKLPPEIEEDTASLIEPLAVAVHTVRKTNLKVGDTVSILGAGPIGILIALIAKRAGAENIIISDINKYRLSIASSYGFITVDAARENVLDIIHQYTDGVGADVVFEVAGNQTTVDQMIPAIKSQGEIMIVSVFKQAPQINLAQMHFRELSLSTTRCFTSDDFSTAVQILKNKAVDLGPLISHRLPLDEIEHGFNLVKESADSMKILFHI